MSAKKKQFKSKSPQDVKMSMDSLKEKEVEEHPRNDPFDFEIKEDNVMPKPISHFQKSKKLITVKAKRISPIQTNKKIKLDDTDEEDDDALFEDTSNFKKMKVNHTEVTATKIDDSDTIQEGIAVFEVKSQAKKCKVDPHSKITEVGEKVITLFEEQSEARQKLNKTAFEQISKVKSSYESDLNVMEDKFNVEKFRQISGSIQKCLKQVMKSIEANKNSLGAIQAFQKRLDKMESTQAEEQKNLLKEFENDIVKFEKMSKEQTRRRMSHVMQNNDF